MPRTTEAELPVGILGAKVVVIGAGMVGSAFAYTLIMSGIVRRLALIDQDPGRAEGEAMDLMHSLSFLQPVQIQAGGYELCKDASVVVITAGAAQKPGQTRLDLTRQNAEIVKSIIPLILAENPQPIILMVSNPVDVLTYVALKESGLPPSKVMGSGTVLDSARFRHLLAQNCGVDVRNVHAYVIGEHGDSEVMVWSRANIAGEPITAQCPVCTHTCMLGVREGIDDRVRKAAYEIIRRKRATYWAIGMAMNRIVEAVLKDQRSVLTVSTITDGPRGISDVCLSLPRIVGSEGVEREIAIALDAKEEKALARSVEVLRGYINSVYR